MVSFNVAGNANVALTAAQWGVGLIVLQGALTGHDHQLELVLDRNFLGHCSENLLKRVDDQLGFVERRAQPRPLRDDD